MADATQTGTTNAGSAAADGPAGKQPCDCKCECPCSPTTLWTDYVMLASVEDPSPRAMALPLPERRPSTTALYDLVTPPRGVLMPMADMTEEVQGSAAASWGQWAGRAVAYDTAFVLPDQLVLGASAGRYGDVLDLPPPGRPGWRTRQGGTLARPSHEARAVRDDHAGGAEVRSGRGALRAWRRRPPERGQSVASKARRRSRRRSVAEASQRRARRSGPLRCASRREKVGPEAAPGGFVGAAAPAAAGGWERPDRGGDARSAGPAGQFQQLTIQRTEQEQHRLDAQRSMDAVTAPALAKMAALSPGGKAAATSGLAAAQRFEGFSDTLRPAMGEIQRTTDALAAQVGVSRDMLPMGPGPAASTLPGHGTDPFAPIDVQAQKGTEAYAQAGLAAQSRVTQEPNAASDYRALQDRMRAATQLLQARGGSGFAAGGPSGEASYQQTPGSTEAPAGGGFGVAPAASAPAADGLTASSATTPASSSASSASGEPPSAAAAQSASLTASAAAEPASSAAPASSTIHASPTATAPSSERHDEHVTAYDLDTVRPASDHEVGGMLRAESATSGRDALVADASGFVHDLSNPDTVAEPVGQSAGGSPATLPSLPRKGQVLRPEGSSGPGLDASAPLGAAGDRGIMSVDAGAARAAGPDLGLAPASGRSAGIALPSTGTARVAPSDPFGLSLGAAASAEDDARTLGIGGPGLGREAPARLPEQMMDDRIQPLGGGDGGAGAAFDDDVAWPIGEVAAATRSGAAEVDLGANGAYAGGPGIAFAGGATAATGFASSAGTSPWGTRADGSGQYGVSSMPGTDVSLLDREQVSRPGKGGAPLPHYEELRYDFSHDTVHVLGGGRIYEPSEKQRAAVRLDTAKRLLDAMYGALPKSDDPQRNAIIRARGRRLLLEKLALDIYLDQLKLWKDGGRKPPKPDKDTIEQELSDLFDEAETPPEPADPPPPPEGGVPAAPADACGCDEARKRCEETCPVPCVCTPTGTTPDTGGGTNLQNVRGARPDLGPDALYEEFIIRPPNTLGSSRTPRVPRVDEVTNSLLDGLGNAMVLSNKKKRRAPTSEGKEIWAQDGSDPELPGDPPPSGLGGPGALESAPDEEADTPGEFAPIDIEALFVLFLLRLAAALGLKEIPGDVVERLASDPTLLELLVAEAEADAMAAALAKRAAEYDKQKQLIYQFASGDISRRLAPGEQVHIFLESAIMERDAAFVDALYRVVELLKGTGGKAPHGKRLGFGKQGGLLRKLDQLATTRAMGLVRTAVDLDRRQWGVDLTIYGERSPFAPRTDNIRVLAGFPRVREHLLSVLERTHAPEITNVFDAHEAMRNDRSKRPSALDTLRAFEYGTRNEFEAPGVLATVMPDRVLGLVDLIDSEGRKSRVEQDYRDETLAGARLALDRWGRIRRYSREWEAMTAAAAQADSAASGGRVDRGAATRELEELALTPVSEWTTAQLDRFGAPFRDPDAWSIGARQNGALIKAVIWSAVEVYTAGSWAAGKVGGTTAVRGTAEWLSATRAGGSLLESMAAARETYAGMRAAQLARLRSSSSAVRGFVRSWANFRAELGGSAPIVGELGPYPGRLGAILDRFGIRQGYRSAIINQDELAGGSWFARTDTAAHEGFHAFVARYFPTFRDLSHGNRIWAAAARYPEEVLAYNVGHAAALRPHGLGIAPVFEAFESLGDFTPAQRAFARWFWGTANTAGVGTGIVLGYRAATGPDKQPPDFK